jgi:hypothetical protein
MKTDTHSHGKKRLFLGACISGVNTLPDEEPYDHERRVLRGFVGSREFMVSYVETSGEFFVVDANEPRELSRTDLRDLAAALARYRQTVPWEDDEAARIQLGLNDAIFPARLEHFQARSISDLGPVILLTGRTEKEDVDVLLDTVTGTLNVMVCREGRVSKKRRPTMQEAHDLKLALQTMLEGRTHSRETMLLRVVLDAAHRGSMHA